MRIKALLLGVSLVSTLGATVAAAFPPLQNPPFTAGGYVPGRLEVFRSQLTVSAFLASYLTARANRDGRLVGELHERPASWTG